MKKLYILIAIIVVILCIFETVIYPKILFHRIDQRLQVKYYRDALDYALKAKKLARWTGNHPVYLKALLYEIQCKQNLDVNDSKIIDLLRAEKINAKTPTREIISIMYAEKLWNYKARMYRRGEEMVNSNNIEDVTTWSIEMAEKELLKNLLEIKAKERKLKKIPFNQYKRFIAVNYDDDASLSLYDFLCLRSLNLLIFGNRYMVFSDSDNIPLEPFFTTDREFLKMNFNQVDTLNNKALVMQTFQTLLKLHKNDFDPAFYMETEIMRLEYLRDQVEINEKSNKYLAILNTYRNHFHNRNALLKIDYAMVKEYNRINNRKLLLEKCKDILLTYSAKKDEVKSCVSILNKLDEKNAGIVVKEFVSKNEKLEIGIRQRNLSTIYAKVFKLPLFNYVNTSDYRSIEDTICYTVRTEKSQYQNKLNFSNVSDNIGEKKFTLNNLKYGNYLVIISQTDHIRFPKDILDWKTFTISDLGYFYYDQKGQNELYVVQRSNGKPIKGAISEIIQNKKILYKYTSDQQGRIRMNGNIQSEYFIKVGYKGDTIIDNESNYDSYEREEKRKDIQYFTDRKVYRPGQTVYFKGLITNQDKDIRTIKPICFEKVKIYLKSYGNILDQKLMLTNEFGSFSGSFVIPAKCPLGDIYLGSADRDEYSFRVEEYKPSKLSLTLIPITQFINFGDSIHVKGYVNYLNGTPARNMSVEYSIHRSSDRYQYRNFKKPKTVGFVQSDNNGNFIIPFLAKKTENVDKKELCNYLFSIKIKDQFGEIKTAELSVPVGKSACDAEILIDKFLIKHSNLKIPINFTYNNSPLKPNLCKLRIYQMRPPTRLIKRIFNEDYGYGYDYDQRDKDENDTIAREFIDLDFHTMSKGQLVFEKVLSPQKTEFYADELNKQQPGFYVAELEALIDGKVTITGQKYFALIEGNNAPTSLMLDNIFVPVKTNVLPGEKASYIIGSALPDIYVLIVLQKNETIVKSEWIHLKNSQQLIEISINENYRGGITICALFYGNNRFFKNHDVIQVPFDNKKLNLNFTSYRDKLYPGEKETWKLKVTNLKGVPAKAEMVAALYDASLDEIEPNSFCFFPYNEFVETNYMNNNWSHASTNTNNIKSLYSYLSPYLFFEKPWPTINWKNIIIKERQKFDNIRALERNDSPQVCCIASSRDISMDAFSEGSPPPPPPPPSADVVRAVRFNAPVVVAEIKDDEVIVNEINKPINKTPNPKVTRKNFKETAFFIPNARTNNNGEITMSFTMPDGLTRWKMCGFAHTRDMQMGSIEKELITRKTLMVMPNWPRFLRAGDSISFNIRIENSSIEDMKGLASIEFLDALSRKPISQLFIPKGIQNFAVSKNSNALVNWKLFVPESLGAVLIRVKASAGNLSDGEEMVLPVLSNELLITESLPIMIKGKDEQVFNFKSFQANRSSTLRNQKFAFEFTPNPVWNTVFSLPYLIEYPYDCAEQTFNKYFGYSVAEYIMNNSSTIQKVVQSVKKSPKNYLSDLEKNADLKTMLLEESPWLFDAKNESSSLQKLPELFNAKVIEEKKSELWDKLVKFQKGGGLPWFSGMEPSDYISLHVLEGLGKLNKMHPVPESAFTSALIDYCDRILDSWYKTKDKKSDLSINSNIIQYLYSRSYFVKEDPISKERRKAYSYLLDMTTKQWAKTNTYENAMIAMALYRNGNTATCKVIIEALRQMSTKSDELGMYWPVKQDYFWYTNPIEAQAAIIELFIETGQPQDEINNLKTWLLTQRKNNQWPSTISTAKACYSMLLKDNEWLNAQPSYQISIGKTQINTKTENNALAVTGYVRKTWDPKEISKDMGVIKIKPAQNSGTPAWGAVYWQYFEKINKVKSPHSNLWVKKYLYLKQNKQTKLVSLGTVLHIGDEVIVHLEFGTDRDMQYVHLKDMRASCLEPMEKTSAYKYHGNIGYFESIRDVAQNFFIENLPMGKHIIEYTVRVTHDGRFASGNASIQCMYSPEYIGYSDSFMVRIGK